jgi:hypothetical protein
MGPLTGLWVVDHKRRKERLLVETRLGDPKHSGLARGWKALPRDERVGSFANGEETDAEACSFTFGWPEDGDG